MSVSVTASDIESLPASIEDALGRVRSRLRRRALSLGLTRVAITVVAFVASTFVLDRLLELPAPFRAVLLLGGAGWTASTAYRHLLRPLAAASSNDQLALLIERAHPDLNDCLVSAVQLARTAEQGGAYHSLELVRTVIDDAAERVRRVAVERAVDTRDLGRLMLLTLAVAGALGIVFARRERDARIWYERMVLLRDTPWPRTVELDVRVEEPMIARGDDITIVARVVRGAPTRVLVQPRFQSAGRGDELAMVEARGEWRATFENVNEPFRFYVEGGDYRSAWFEVAVRARPKLEEIRLWLVHPPHTGLGETPAEEPLRDGNVKVPGGTLVRFEGASSEPLAAAEVAFGAPGAVGDVRPAAPLPGNLRRFGGEFRVKESTSWSVRLVSREGVETSVAAQYAIRAIPDRLPDVRIVRPGRNRDVARKAAPALRIEVRDDYLPKAAALVFTTAGARRSRTEQPAADAPETRVPLPGLPPQDGQKQASIDHSFDLGAVGLDVGDRVTYWVEAVDQRAPEAEVTSVPPESRGRSERYQFTVIGDEDLERAQQAALKRVRDDLVVISKAQKAAQGELEALATELSGRAPDARDRRRLTYAELDQGKIRQRLEQAEKAIGEVRDEKAQNRVSKEEELNWLTELEASADAIGRDAARTASQGLAELRASDRPPDPERILGVTGAQGDVIESVNELVRRLDKWDEFNDVIRDLRDILQVQERIQRDTQERVKKELKR